MNTYTDQDASMGNEASQHREGKIARSIEKQTAKIPSDVFLWAAGASLVASLTLEVVGMFKPKKLGLFGSTSGNSAVRQPLAGFVAHWVPTLLLFGIYNKIVKVAGSDRLSR